MNNDPMDALASKEEPEEVKAMNNE